MDKIKRLAVYLGEYKWYALATPVLVVLGAVMELLAPALMSKLIDNGVNVGDIGAIVHYSWLIMGCSLLALGFSIAGAICGARAEAGFAKNLRAGLYARIQDFAFENIDRFSAASLITRLTTDVSRLQNALGMLMRMAIRAPAMLVIALTIAMTMNGKLSLIYLVTMPLVALGMYVITTSAHPHFKKLFKIYDKLNLVVEENVRAIRVVKTFVREKYETAKFKKVSADIYREFSLAERILAFTSPLMEFASYLAILLIAWFGAHLIVVGEFSVGQLMSMISYTMNILFSLMMISMTMVMLVMSKAALDRIDEVLVEPIKLTSPKNGLQKLADGSVSFKHVDFSYANDGQRLALKDINLTIAAGQTVGILGGTGSGKTSLVSLIPRLYDATAGKVLVGGVDVRDYDLSCLRREVAMVLQKNVLFSGTIAQNLRWGNPHATLKELEQACKQAQIHDFIKSLPRGYQTQVEQGGTNFSGGQKQRLCIARAVLAKPKVLILDDSTSAVDTKTESLIRQAWQKQIPGTTIIVIAQRVLSVKDADQIVVMDRGKIVGVGTHKQLLKNNQIYQEVYQSQIQEQA